MLRKRAAARRTHCIRPCFERLEDRAMLTAGDLDLSFGGDGRVTTDIGMLVESIETARSVAIQPDGKIVATGSTGEGGSGFGDFVLARYNPDGSLDTSFGGATGLPGTVRTDLRGSDPVSNDRALD